LFTYAQSAKLSYDKELPMKLAGNILAAVLILYGLLNLIGAGDPDQGGGVLWLVIGGILVAIGLAIIWYVNRKEPGEQKVTYNVELSGDVNLENFDCKKCGGALSNKNVSLVGGAATVTCPYCGAVYQLEEKPKW
jgi:hypothetical protein